MSSLKKALLKGFLLAVITLSPLGVNNLQAAPDFESEDVSVQPVIGIGIDFGYPNYYYSYPYYGYYRPYYYSPYYYNYNYYPYYYRYGYYGW